MPRWVWWLPAFKPGKSLSCYSCVLHAPQYGIRKAPARACPRRAVGAALGRGAGLRTPTWAPELRQLVQCIIDGSHTVVHAGQCCTNELAELLFLCEAFSNLKCGLSSSRISMTFTSLRKNPFSMISRQPKWMRAWPPWFPTYSRWVCQKSGWENPRKWKSA